MRAHLRDVFLYRLIRIFNGVDIVRGKVVRRNNWRSNVREIKVHLPNILGVIVLVNTPFKTSDKVLLTFSIIPSFTKLSPIKSCSLCGLAQIRPQL